ncbi:MAG TPA: hypothetical protein VFQ44_29555 [Streptosporangiaceae bacterium]|nr:hypothetical protein [Streptosporangiaceae bacterium]
MSQLLFSSARDGWAFGPGLWRTRDGGRAWSQVSIGGWLVQSLAVAGPRLLAVAGACGAADRRHCAFGVFTLQVASTGTVRWRPVPGASRLRTSAVMLATSGRTRYVLRDHA